MKTKQMCLNFFIRYLKTATIFLTILFLLLLTSCKKFVEINPPKDQIITSVLYESDATAISAIRGIYNQMMAAGGFASGTFSGITVLGGVSADEFVNHYATIDEFYKNSLTPLSIINQNDLWNAGYKYIYYTNAVIEGLANSSKVTTATKTQLTGEAKFLRAFCHFNLVNLYGDIPLITTTDYRVNRESPRTPKAQVYQQIIVDLIDAQSLLVSDYSSYGNERVRVNKGAATALLARVYLYIQDWVNAEAQATLVLNNSTLYNLVTNLNNVFLRNSSEAIWQLMPVAAGANTNEALYFIPTTSTSVPQFISLTSQLYNAFEVGDNRKTSWVGTSTVTTPVPATYYYPYKYKIRTTGQPLTEYSMVLRLAEQYLIRAEARAQQNNVVGAQADVNAIRNRAFGVPSPTPANDKPSLLLAIEKERRIELFSEWGHRWYDLKRTGRADAILGPIKGSNWQATDVLYPIPQSEILNNPNLTQNQGY